MSTSSTATISGIASGIDWQSTVDALMEIEYQPVQRLLDKQDEYAEKNSAWDVVEQKLSALQSASTTIDSVNELLLKNASSANTDALSVVADADATSGTHTVEINQLAQNQVIVHTDGWADANTTSITTGGTDFTYTYDGVDYTVSVTSGSTLSELISNINDDPDNPGITASYIDDGGAADPIHLVLSVDDPTASDLLSINDALTTIGTGAGEFDSAAWTTTQNAQEAEIRVDGFPPGSWITRTTNEIDDVIPGVTLTLKDTNLTGIQVTVTDDYSAIKTRISSWVDAYNDTLQTINDYTSYDAENEVRGVLMDDSQIKTVRSRLINIVSSEIPGLPTNAIYTTLGSVGVDIISNGKLSINSSDLQDALEEDPEAVANLFAQSDSSTTSTLEFFRRSENTEGGTYSVTAYYTAAGKLDSSQSNTIGGYAATVEGTNVLVGKDGSPVEGLRVYFNYPGGGAGSVTGTVRLGEGVANSSYYEIESLSDNIDGLISIVKDGYQDTIDSLEDQIAAYEDRLDLKREMLEKQFIAMESAIAEVQNQSSWISSAL